MYNFIKKIGKFIRDNFTPNPTKILEALGFVGKTIGTILNFVIFKILCPLAFGITGIFYKKGKQPAWVGSFLYTLFFIGLAGLVSSGITSLFG